MFLLCFWDIIYGSYPPNHLFINQFQDCPLDWRTRHFYKIREQDIKVKTMINIIAFILFVFLINCRTEWQN